jgi:catechol-2,3-dioxygenase
MDGILGIHHVKYPVSDLVRSRSWYETVLRFELMMEFVEEGIVRGVALCAPGTEVILALREDAQHAAGVAGFDPVAFLVEDRRSLQRWVEHFDHRGIKHGPIEDASIGWIVEVQDPDGIQVRLYTRESRYPKGTRNTVPQATGSDAGAMS